MIQGQVFYYNYDTRHPDIPTLLKPHEIIHFKSLSIDGLMGKSPLRTAAESVGIGIASENYGAKLFGNSSVPTGYLKSKEALDAAKSARIKENWKKNQGGANQGDIAILQGDLDYVKVMLSPEESQFLETRKYSKLEIATLYGIPPHKLADLDRATFSNIEEQNIQFVEDTLSNYAAEIEWEYRIKLLKEDEQANHYFKYDFSSMLQGNSKDQAETLSKLISTGLLSINEGRGRLNANKVEGGDERYMQMSYIPISMIDEYYRSQMAAKGAPATRQDVTGFLKALQDNPAIFNNLNNGS